MERNIPTTFATAVGWLHNSIIRCNDIPEIDPSIIDNARFKLTPYYEDDEGQPYDDPKEYADFISERYEDRIKELEAKEEDGFLSKEEKETLEDLRNRIEHPEEYLDEVSNKVFQWYLTSCSEDDVKYLENTFGLDFTYSDLLGLYVLAVTHYGTSWDYVYWTTNNPNAKCELGKRIN